MMTTQDTTTVRLPRSLVEQIRTIADAHERSIAAELRVALNEYIRREQPDVDAKPARRAKTRRAR